MLSRVIDRVVFRPLGALCERRDKADVRRSAAIRAIPPRGHRTGGKASYAEWAHVIGLFQGLMAQAMPDAARAAPRILDVGCGSGLLALSAQPLLGEAGRYTGIDTQASEVAFCRRRYARFPNLAFIHHGQANPHYNPEGRTDGPWAVEDASVDLVTALSVWTHLDERDARALIAEVGRVLVPGGRALITVFVLDAGYDPAHIRAGATVNPHATDPARWIFDRPTRGSAHWFHPVWADDVPEKAIALDMEGIAALCADGGLTLHAHWPGHWKQRAGLYFQDVLVFEKPAA